MGGASLPFSTAGLGVECASPPALNKSPVLSPSVLDSVHTFASSLRGEPAVLTLFALLPVPAAAAAGDPTGEYTLVFKH